LPESELAIGGRYVLEAAVGGGGMGVVYRARDLILDRVVAVKLLRADTAAEPGLRDQFLREARLAAKLTHPRIVAVYDSGEHVFEDQAGSQVRPYLVMEFVEGESLGQLLRRDGPVSLDRAIEVVGGVLSGLAHAHEKGLVHRDIKPDNILVEPSGLVKVVDFGIARIAGQPASASSDGINAFGTAFYMSPEQSQTSNVDNRSDLYSVGCVLYEMVTGRPPFLGETPYLTVVRHLTENAVPPSDLVPGLSANLDAIIARAMAKEPALRYQSAAQFLTDLGRVAVGLTPSAAVLLPAQVLAPPVLPMPPPPVPSPAPLPAAVCPPSAAVSSPAAVAMPIGRSQRFASLVVVGVLALALFGYLLLVWWLGRASNDNPLIGSLPAAQMAAVTIQIDPASVVPDWRLAAV
jgi:serine/threonine-protein kinase